MTSLFEETHAKRVEAASKTFYELMTGEVPHLNGWAGHLEPFKARVRERMAAALAAADAIGSVTLANPATTPGERKGLTIEQLVDAVVATSYNEGVSASEGDSEFDAARAEEAKAALLAALRAQPSAEAPAQDDEHVCVACEKPLRDGDLYYEDVNEGPMHAECCGPEPEAFVGADGDPLKAGDRIPAPSVYCADPRAEALAPAIGEREVLTQPVAWVIPGEDNPNVNGFIDAMCVQEGEFTRPLYAHPALASPTVSPSGDRQRVERVRHVKRGTEYEVLHRGVELQVSVARGEPVELLEGTLEPDFTCCEEDRLVIYLGTDGRVWAREESEFDDGRFVPAAPTISVDRQKVDDWRPIAEANHECTLYELMVPTPEGGGLRDALTSLTIGSNNGDHDGEDRWTYVGWNWEQDCYVHMDTVEGAPMPIMFREMRPDPDGRTASDPDPAAPTTSVEGA